MSEDRDLANRVDFVRRWTLEKKTPDIRLKIKLIFHSLPVQAVWKHMQL